jgi:hypothetical protein
MILKKSSNNDLEVLATKNGPWAFYKTKTAANNDLANIPEGSIVAIEEASSTAIDSLPVGTWASFENTDSAPNSQWIKAGTTFDENDYPELYLYLGTNIVPSRYDHSRLGVYQSITLPTTSSTAMTMPYDGVLMYQPNISSGFSWVYINGQNVVFDKGNIGNNSNGSSSALTVPFRKGDSLRVNQVEGSISKVAYYDKPLFIKAKSFVEESVPNEAIETVKDYIKSYADNVIAYNRRQAFNDRCFINSSQVITRTADHTGLYKVYAHKSVNGYSIMLEINGYVIDAFGFYGTDSSGTALPWGHGNPSSGADITLSAFVKKGDVIKIYSDDNSSATTNSWYVYSCVLQYKEGE